MTHMKSSNHYGRKQYPFLVELDILLDKYKPMFKKLEYKSLDEILNSKGKHNDRNN